MKRFFVLMSLVLFSVLLVACDPDPKTDEIIVEKAAETLVLPATTDKDLILLTKIEVDEVEIAISWTSANTAVITNEGKITKSKENITVVLTAELSLNRVSLKKTFSVTVSKEDVIVPGDETKPVISGLVREHEVVAGTTLTEETILLGVVATDDVDGDITNKIIVSGLLEVDFETEGVYSIILEVTDMAGNTASETVTITVKPGVVKEGTAISTPEEFYAILGGTEIYYLANDIDFSGYDFVQTTLTFKGVLDGNNMTIKNLNILNVAGTAGIFAKSEGTVKDLNLLNVHVSSTGNRAGILVGETSGPTTFRNIKITDSSVSGNNNNGVGALLGMVKKSSDTDINGVILRNVIVSNTTRAVGGLIGCVDGSTINITDADIEASITSLHADGRVGGLIGEIKNGGIINALRVVIDATLDGSIEAGGIVGRFAGGTSSISDTVVLIDFLKNGKDTNYLAGKTSGITITNSYGYSVVEIVAPDVTTIIDGLESLSSTTWWSANIPELKNNNWIFNGSKKTLDGASVVPIEKITIGINFVGVTRTRESIQIEKGTDLSTLVPTLIGGYFFLGWYQDENLSTPLNLSDLVDGDLEIYASYRVAESYVVNIDGIYYITINEGQKLSKPTTPIKPGFEFKGFYHNNVEYDFNAILTEGIELVTEWDSVEQYTITLVPNEGTVDNESLLFYENELVKIDNPRVAPEYRFVGWYLESELINRFNQQYISSDVTLYAKYADATVPLYYDDFDSYELGSDLATNGYSADKPGSNQIILKDGQQTLLLTEESTEAIYSKGLGEVTEGRYILFYEFYHGSGGAAFTIELTRGSTRVFTVGANRANRLTYRESNGTEFSVPAAQITLTPGINYQTSIVVDTVNKIYKYFIRESTSLDWIEITPSRGVGFITESLDLSINTIRIRTAGHKGSASAEPIVGINQILIETTSEDDSNKSIYDPETPIDYTEEIQKLIDAFEIPFKDSLRNDITLPNKIGNYQARWTTSDPLVVTKEGIVTRHESNLSYADLTLTIYRDLIEISKTISVTILPASDTLTFNTNDYSLRGFAKGAVSIADVREGDNGYYKVNDEKEFLEALAAEENAKLGTYTARIIEITNDLNLGYNEVTNKYPGVSFRYFESHNAPSMHPWLLESGISKVRIEERNPSNAKHPSGITIFSKNGNTIKHATFNVKRSVNMIFRNLKFDELWEWDESGSYDSKDWDYFTIEDVKGIWFDHIELGKSYDGLIDFKYGTGLNDSVTDATFSYLKMNYVANDFVRAQVEYLAQAKTSTKFNKIIESGMTLDDMTTLLSFQKKGFLLGGSSNKPGNAFTLSIYNSHVVNLQDRFPRLRGTAGAGDVHIFNNYYDATDVYDFKMRVDNGAWNGILSTSGYDKFLTNQAIVTTENGAILAENMVFKGITQVIKSNQSSPGDNSFTGKYKVINSYYELGDYSFFGGSDDIDTPFFPSNIGDILPFSWNRFETLPYEGDYNLIDVNVLEEYLLLGIMGATNLPFDWLTLEYI